MILKICLNMNIILELANIMSGLHAKNVMIIY